MTASFTIPLIPSELLGHDLPPRYDTAWSFLLREEPASLAYTDDPVAAFSDFVVRAMSVAERHGAKPIYVTSNAENAEIAIAYPAWVWDIVFG